ncbi:nicotinate-nucleotide adenylyltransferase [Halobacillus sp. Marseille-Q1614]|uniref:nicotinate-nucleotide adenylyltransferase n=1 Tax=Halobacillus sp. Marseille-Q1614 TaxID=2709134 RepID=UPI00156F6F6D|nr:nicotinate-nucleotide adenylyltransferase [Halobacillus sp. Marseille-Q1614]
MKRIGILGGTFDPPHIGHLLMAEYVYEQVELDEIWFIPSHLPPHKQEAAVSAEDRLQMVKEAIKGNPHFKVNSIEMDRTGKSYTLDTMKELKRLYPEYSFSFIIGGDMIQYLNKWHRIDELTQLVQFIGVSREGFEPGDSEHNVKMAELPRIDISSSMIRSRAANGQSIRYTVTENVYTYIKENALYEVQS